MMVVLLDALLAVLLHLTLLLHSLPKTCALQVAFTCSFPATQHPSRLIAPQPLLGLPHGPPQAQPEPGAC